MIQGSQYTMILGSQYIMILGSSVLYCTVYTIHMILGSHVQYICNDTGLAVHNDTGLTCMYIITLNSPIQYKAILGRTVRIDTGHTST